MSDSIAALERLAARFLGDAVLRASLPGFSVRVTDVPHAVRTFVGGAHPTVHDAPGAAEVTLELNSADLAGITGGALNPQALYLAGRLRLRGRSAAALPLWRLFSPGPGAFR